MNGSLGVRGSIYVECYDWSRESFELKNSLWKKTRVNEISSGSGVNEHKGVDVFLRPCREIGIHIVLFSWDATSTWFKDWEEDIKAASLLKNPMLCELRWGMWIFWLIFQVLHSTS